GGREAGAGSDPLATQGSLTLVPDAGLLLAVNAGSDTISVFHVDGDRLELRQVLPSGGPFPTAFAVQDNLVYVLDAGGQGFVSGYRIAGGRLHPIEGSTRTLLLGNAPVPFFLSSPAEVGFTPGGEHLIVTTKTHNTFDVFSAGPDGRLAAAPGKDAAVAACGMPGATDSAATGRFLDVQSGLLSTVHVFSIGSGGSLTPVQVVAVPGGGSQEGIATS